MQKAADNELIQAASRKVQEAAKAVADNEMVQAAIHNVQAKAQKLSGQQEMVENQPDEKLMVENTLKAT